MVPLGIILFINVLFFMLYGGQKMKKISFFLAFILLFTLLLSGTASAELPAPENIGWKEGSLATAVWDTVEGADDYLIRVYVYHGGNLLGEQLTGTTINELDVQQEIHRILDGREFDLVQVAFSVAAGVTDAAGEVSWGEESAQSPLWDYDPSSVQMLPFPSYCEVTEDGILRFSAVEHAEYYNVEGWYCDPYTNNYTLGIGYTIYASEAENGIIEKDLEIESLYSGMEGFEISFEINLQVCSDDEAYLNRAMESAGYITWYHVPGIPVESLTLSPSAPILFAGHERMIGKTIEPIDAYYNEIIWETNNESVVSVDENGKITGLVPGNAEITARIGDAACTVPVTVYTIASNIEDDEDQQEVTDTAGTIIDELGNEDEPDIQNTDIEEDRIEDLQEQIHEGLERGDEFHTDILLSKRDWVHFEKYWEDIQQYLSDGNFACAFDIQVEIYHQDGNGNKYHIANITQLGDEIGFVIDSEALPETAPGQLRDFTLIRIHDGVLESVPVKNNGNGTFSAESDRFSDFILMYVDRDDLSGLPTLALPENVEVISSEAFSGTAVEVIIIPYGCREVASDAFKDCGNLKYIVNHSALRIEAPEGVEVITE